MVSGFMISPAVYFSKYISHSSKISSDDVMIFDFILHVSGGVHFRAVLVRVDVLEAAYNQPSEFLQFGPYEAYLLN